MPSPGGDRGGSAGWFWKSRFFSRLEITGNRVTSGSSTLRSIYVATGQEKTARERFWRFGGEDCSSRKGATILFLGSCSFSPRSVWFVKVLNRFRK